MYTEHFGLHSEPFGLTPDPAFLFPSAGHSEALAALRIGIEGRRGLIVMVGEVGTGKTTLLYSLLPAVSAEVKVAYITNTKLSFDELLAQALADFGVACRQRGRRQLLARFTEFLLKCAERGEVAALVIDEAQNLEDHCLENLRLLSNVETYAQKLLQVVLVGQPELLEKLSRPNLRQLRERIAVYSEIKALSWRDSYAYVNHRLQQAGGTIDLFSRPALALLLWHADGIPRRINILCHNALLFAYGRDQKRVTLSQVITALRSRPRRVRFHKRARRQVPEVVQAVSERLRSPESLGAVVQRPGLLLAVLALASVLGWGSLHWTGDSATRAQSAVGIRAATAGDAPLPQPRPKIVRVASDASLIELTRQVYGRAEDELIDRVRSVNPRIAAAEQVAAGEVLIFPPVANAGRVGEEP
ncbi:MAG TPA: AAA family ATPase [Terriglobales bacterium]|nr:AAA family ATPase [Terriglobales bacterium]